MQLATVLEAAEAVPSHRVQGASVRCCGRDCPWLQCAADLAGIGRSLVLQAAALLQATATPNSHGGSEMKPVPEAAAGPGVSAIMSLRQTSHMWKCIV